MNKAGSFEVYYREDAAGLQTETERKSLCPFAGFVLLFY